jgi:hypothetical protein
MNTTSESTFNGGFLLFATFNAHIVNFFSFLFAQSVFLLLITYADTTYHCLVQLFFSEDPHVSRPHVTVNYLVLLSKKMRLNQGWH